jgi:hypothetical protein
MMMIDEADDKVRTIVPSQNRARKTLCTEVFVPDHGGGRRK